MNIEERTLPCPRYGKCYTRRHVWYPTSPELYGGFKTLVCPGRPRWWQFWR